MYILRLKIILLIRLRFFEFVKISVFQMQIQRFSLLELTANRDTRRLQTTLNSQLKCHRRNGQYTIQRCDDLVGFIIGQVAISFILGKTK